jgi:hypothetical protein
MNDDIKSLPNGDFYVVPAKKQEPKPVPQPVKSHVIRTRPKNG